MKHLKYFENNEYDEVENIFNIARDEGFVIHCIRGVSRMPRTLIIQRRSDNRELLGESDEKFIRVCEEVRERMLALGADETHVSCLIFHDDSYFAHHRNYIKTGQSLRDIVVTREKGDEEPDLIGEVCLQYKLNGSSMVRVR